MLSSDNRRITPTAHYTGFVWYRNGLSHPAFKSRRGWLLYSALQPVNAASGVAGGPVLEDLLVARHRVIDHLLTRAIESGRVSQVVELGAGLSPRGWRFAERYAARGLRYIEGDLPAVTERKRQLVQRAGLQQGNHRVIDVDAAAEHGVRSLGDVCKRHLDPELGTAIITEGLLSCLAPWAARSLFARIGATLGRYPAGLFLSDLLLRDELGAMPGARLMRTVLQLVGRGPVHMHFAGTQEASEVLHGAGFDRVLLHRASDFAENLVLEDERRTACVRVVEAWV